MRFVSNFRVLKNSTLSINNSFLQSIVAFLENSPSIYFSRIDMQGKYTYVNQLYKKDFAYLYNNFIGETAIQSVHPDDVDICNNAGILCIQNPDKIVSVDFRKAGDDGIDIYIHWNFFVLKNENGEIEELGCIGYNNTKHHEEKNEHKTTIQKLQAALNSSDESFYFLDKEMKVLSFNQGAKNASKILFNVTMHEGYDFTKNLVSGTEESFFHQFQQALAGNEISKENEITFPTGLNIWYKLSMKPVHDDKGEIIGVALSYINIDTLKKTGLRLKEIAWHQSHKVRKPLTNILGLIDLLKESGGNTEVIDMLESSAKELDEMIKQVVAKTLL
jgi:PAS domain-containing protein